MFFLPTNTLEYEDSDYVRVWFDSTYLLCTEKKHHSRSKLFWLQNTAIINYNVKYHVNSKQFLEPIIKIMDKLFKFSINRENEQSC